MKLILSAKCRDMCYVRIEDSEHNVLHEHDGYVPDYIPNDFGDYVELEIDPETGVILNWVPEKIKELLK